MSRQAWATALLMAIVPLSAWGQKDCPAPRKVIEKLPYFDEWSNCDSSGNDLYVGAYKSKSCLLANVDYPAAEVVYELKLHQGNQVSFLLEPIEKDGKPNADLVLALLNTCGDGASCASSSADFIGLEPEEISAAKYGPGVYYLNVDSAEGPCGHYRLSVLGVNPTPELSLDVTADRSRAVAGERLTYTLKVTNSGDGPASNVILEQSLPPGTIPERCSDQCEFLNGKAQWKTAAVASDWQVSVTVRIPAEAQGRLTSTASVKANEGLPAEDKITTAIDHVHDLSIQLSATSSQVVAGRTRTYTLTLRNDGPSDATDVKVVDTLDRLEQLVPGSTAVFEIPLLEANSTLSKTFTVNVKPSATTLSNRATIGTATGREPKPNRGPNEARLDTLVERETDLSIDSIETIPAGPVPAGATFAYVITVRNNGPSDSSGGTLTVDFPDSLSLLGSESCDGPRCDILPIGSGDTRVFRFSVKTSAALGRTTLSSEARVSATEADPSANNNTKNFATDFIVQADLHIAKGEATESVCEGENVLYTIKAHNDGLSNSSAGTVTSVLDGLSFVASLDGCTSSDSRTVICPTGDLSAGGEVDVHFRALPTRSGIVKNTVSAEGEHDPDNEPGIEIETAVSASSDLEVTLSASQDPLKPDQLFTYEVAVTNHGPSDADGVSVNVTLPPGVVSEPGEDCTVCESSCTLSLGTIEVNDTGKTKICARATSQTGAITAGASIADRPCDPDENSTELNTTVAADTDADLSLTLTADRKVVSEGDLLTYTLHVVNHGFAPAEGVKVEIELPGGLTLDSGEDCASIDPQRILCAVGSLAPETAWTGTIAVKVDAAAGSRLETSAEVSVETPTDPNTINNRDSVVTQKTDGTDLCESSSVRFFDGQPAGSSTELHFFVPGHSGGTVATGRVFTESGAFVEEIEVSSDQEAFQYPVDEPVGSGSIEWTFEKDRLGSVTAVHTLRNGDQVAIRGFCRRPGRPGASILVLPFFETNPAVNTYVAVRNETDQEVKVQVTFSGSNEPAVLLLAGHAVRTANLRNLLGYVEGSLEFKAFKPSDEEQPVHALSGDFIRVEPDGLTGSTLVEKEETPED